MLVIPSIDLLGGRVVRLRQGRREDVTCYPDPPKTFARRYAEAGAQRLHVVDLDGAFGHGASAGGEQRRPAALDALSGIAAAGVPVQFGGGLRDVGACERALSAGASFVVVGTAAVRDPGMVRAVARAHPGRVIVAVDAEGGRVRVEGWTADGGEDAADTAARAARLGAAAVLYTDVARDGTGDGPNLLATVRLQMRVPLPVIASGGIGSLDHVRALAAAGVQACVIGRALCEGAFTLADALAASARPGEA